MKRAMVLSVGMVCAFVVQAAVVVNDNLEINEATNVTVASGTVEWHGNLTGGGTITKLGAGTLLVFSTNDAFTGNWEVKEGSLKTGSTINKRTQFLGTGKITVYASTEHDSCIEVWTSILPNEVEVIGRSSAEYPALRANNQASYGKLITADDDLYIYQNGYTGGTQPFANKLIFQDTGRIEAPGKTVSLRPNAQFDFLDDANYVVCDTLETTWSGMQGLGSVRLGSANNHIRLIRTSKARIICGKSNCFGGAALGWFGQDTTEGYTYYHLAGSTTQTAAYLTSDEILASVETSCYSVSNNPGGVSTTLALTGGVETATAYCRLDGKLALSVSSSDGAAFKQRLLNRPHTMTEPITVNANATLALGGGTTFPYVKTVNVNGGTLEIEDGTPFTNYRTSFVLTSGGRVKLASGVELRVKSITVDGVEKVGAFTKDSVGTMVEGDGTLISFGAAPQTLVWATADESADVSVAASWQDSPIFDFVVPDKFIARFAAAGAGARANVSGAINLRGLEFTAENDFTVAAANNAAAISLGSEGLVTAAVAGDDPEKRVYTVEPPVTAAFGQHWTPGADTETRFRDFTVDASVSLTNGHGTVAFEGTTTLNAELKNWYYRSAAAGTDVKTTDDLDRTMRFTGRVEGEGQLSVYGWNGACVVLSNAVVACPFYWYGTGSHKWSYRWFNCPKDTTNEISGAVTCASASYLKIDTGAVLTLSGGATFGNKLSIDSSGTLVITNKPVVTTATLVDNNAFLAAAGGNSRFVLAASSNTFTRAYAGGAKATFEFAADYTVSTNCIKQVINNCIDVDNSANDATFELNGTHQRFRSIRNVKSKTTTIHGVEPASLGVYMDSTNAAPITGWVALEKLADDMLGGFDQELVLGARAFQSYGDLKVDGGTLAFLAGGSWLNGTNVTVCGTGTLKLPSGSVFSGDHAVLNVLDTGKLDIPSGQIQPFFQAFVDGVQLRAGTYTAANPGALAGHFADGAEGGIVIRNRGTRFILR